jgi:hypothetical protein
MMTGDGPPARNTCSARDALRRARNTHSVPPREMQPTPVQSGLSNHPGIDVPHDEGPRGRTADISPVEDAKPEGGSTPDGDSPSEHGTIRDIPEEVETSQCDQEQSYTTAPASFGPSSDPYATKSSPNVYADKGKGCVRNIMPQNSGSPLSWSERVCPLHSIRADREQAHIEDELNHWSTLAESSRAKVVSL